MSNNQFIAEVRINDKPAEEALTRVNNRLKMLRHELGKTGKEVAEPFHKVGEGLSEIVSPLGALAAGLSAAGLFEGIKSFAEQGEKLKNISQQIGVTSDSYQKLSFAAKQADIDQDTFNTSLQKMVKNVGELRNGQGELHAMFAKSNPAFLAQLQATKDTSTQFSLILKQIRSYSDAGSRMALATAAFGRSGAAMVNLASQNMAEFQENLEFVSKSHAIITKQTQEDSEEFIGSLRRLGMLWQGLTNTVMAALLPFMKELVDSLGHWFMANQQIIAQNITGFMEGLKGIIEAIPWGVMAAGAGAVFDVFKGITYVLGGSSGLLGLLGALIALKFGGEVLTWAKACVEFVKILQEIKPLLIVIDALEAVASMLNPFGWVNLAIMAVTSLATYIAYTCGWFDKLIGYLHFGGHTQTPDKGAGKKADGKEDTHQQSLAEHHAALQHVVHSKTQIDLHHINAPYGFQAHTRAVSGNGVTVNHAYHQGDMAGALGGF